MRQPQARIASAPKVSSSAAISSDPISVPTTAPTKLRLALTPRWRSALRSPR